MDTHARLKQLLRERGWTEYKLSKECGLAQSTICLLYTSAFSQPQRFLIKRKRFFQIEHVEIGM